MDQNVIDEHEATDQQFLASNVEMNNEIIEPTEGGISPEYKAKNDSVAD